MLDFFCPFQGPKGLPGAPGLPGDPGLMGERVSGSAGEITLSKDISILLPCCLRGLHFFISSVLAFLSRGRMVLLGMAQLDSQVPQ